MRAQSEEVNQHQTTEPTSYHSTDNRPHEDPQTSETVVQPASQEDRIQMKDILHFPAPIWLICIICVAYYVAVFPFVSLGLVFFERECTLTFILSFHFDVTPSALLETQLRICVTFEA